MINDIHKKMLNEILGRGQAQSPRSRDESALVIEKDKAVRQAISELYSVLCQARQPDVAVKLLAEHASIMVEMINEFKGKR